MSEAVIDQCAERAVSDYIEHHRDDAARELCYYRSMPALARAIRRGARACTADGGKHPHQWRIPSVRLRAFGAQLARREQALSEAGSFDELHEAVRAVGGPIRGIGELAVYDTAIRIGAWLGLDPERVYLHRGSREGGGGRRGRPSTLHRRRLRTTLFVRAPRARRDRGLPLHLQGAPVGQAISTARRCRCNGGGCARRPAGTARVRC